MSLPLLLFALIVVLLFEQLRPLPVQRIVLDPLRRLLSLLVKRIDDGRYERHEQLIWALLVFGGAAFTAFIFHLLPPVLDIAFAIGTLYLTLGFRHESHYFTDIHFALRAGDVERARELLAEWRGGRYDETDPDEIARLTIGQALVGAHRNVFGVVFWFVVFGGPWGAVLYRLARFLYDEWDVNARRAAAEAGVPGTSENFGLFARHAFLMIDWLPSRMTAVLFAIGGNFEDAVFCWRAQAALWPERGNAVLVTSGAGALGVQLGESGDGETENLEIGVGRKAGVDDMQATVGLVWRALLACLVLLALTAIAVLAG